MTYPLEYGKTVSQLQRTIPGQRRVVDFNQQFKYFFSGCGAMNIGNALKAMSRFVVFNQASKFMATDNGKTSAPRVVIAGAMTGFVESLWIIPFENIKTTMIENSRILSKNEQIALLSKKINSATGPIVKQPVKQTVTKKKSFAELSNLNKSDKTFHNKQAESLQNHPKIIAKAKWDKSPSSNFFQTLLEIYETRGFRGFVQGTFPTLLRQCSTSAVSFTTYTTFRQFFASPNGELNSYMAFASGILSSVFVVALTQPIDVIKTRMQSRETFYMYKSSLNCAYRIFVEEGVRTFWAGWVPRLLKVGTSGGIAFAIYQHVENKMTLILKEKPFQNN